VTDGGQSARPTDPLAGLAPAVRHHIVNTLQWNDLRPLQALAVDPIARGRDALLIAPTASGKTEAALLPLLSRAAEEHWRGLSVLYVCPLRALLNNLAPRVEQLCGFVGMRSAVWHGDVGAGARAAVRRDPPEVLLTTPESVEAMLLSVGTDHKALFAGLQAVIVDEVHAFAGDDRGWHLLAVLARLTHLTGRDLQRIGLSATVGNPADMLAWLTQGSAAAGVVVAPPPVGPSLSAGEITLDHVGSVANAATVISKLHRGDKRLVFADSRSRVEQLAVALRAAGVTTFVSHSSLAADERRRAEAAFAEAQDCVIVATSTLELGIDVGDLDRVIQIDAPPTVASLLQRLGRSGRRAGTARNMLILATHSDALLEAAAVTRRWSEGWVEPVVAPPEPWHLLAQQLLGLSLQEGRIGRATWPEWFSGLDPFSGEGTNGRAAAVVDHLIATGMLFEDAGMLSVGPDAERSYGRRNFIELTSVFTADPLIEVIAGTQPIGSVHPLSLRARPGQPMVVALGGRAWRVEHIDWSRHRAWAHQTDGPGRSVWAGSPRGLSASLARAARSVLAGAEVGATLTNRATAALAAARKRRPWAEDGATVVVHAADHADEWWTFAGLLANAELARRLGATDFDSLAIRLPAGADPVGLGARPDGTDDRGPWEKLAVDLKFAECLPPALAQRTAAARMRDEASVDQALAESVRHHVATRLLN